MSGLKLVHFVQPVMVAISVESIESITLNDAGKVLVSMADGGVLCLEESLGEASRRIFSAAFPSPKLAAPAPGRLSGEPGGNIFFNSREAK